VDSNLSPYAINQWLASAEDQGEQYWDQAVLRPPQVIVRSNLPESAHSLSTKQDVEAESGTESVPFGGRPIYDVAKQ
jgi:hypothetical protein